ncbi:MAG: hypothetical protein ACJZ7Z_06665 [Myxococcota bacterium]
MRDQPLSSERMTSAGWFWSLFGGHSMGTDFTTGISSRARGFAAALLSGWMVLWATGSASASEIVDLRIGAHQDFTRIVFELDRPTGYRIERASPRPGVSELVVSIDATSIPRKIKNKDALIGLVTITPKGKGSLAEIRLSREGLRLKEMILSSPPRIVLDILASPVAAKTTPATPPVAKKVVKPKAKAAKKAASKPAAKPKAKPKAKTSREPTRVVSVPAPKAKSNSGSTAKKPSGTKEPTVVVRTVPAAEPIVAVKLKKPRVADTSEPARKRALKDPQEPMGRNLAVLELEAEEVVRVQPIAPDPERVLEQFKAPPEEEESGNGMLWATLLGVVVLGAVVMVRRRGRSQGGGDDFDEGVEVGGPPAESDNPFAARPTLVETEPFTEDAVEHGEEVADIDLELGDLDDDAEKEEAPVDSHLFGSGTSLDQDAEAEFKDLLGASEQTADEETRRLLSEFERRAEGLERRLEEASEARERLERQVAAQTEELRVQRAAIARTQRAVRNMNRPDDQPPTEPAPRDS